MTEPQKKNGRSTPPGSRSRSSYQRRRRKPTPILHRLAAKCKRLNWRTLLAVLLALLIVFFLTRCTTGSGKDPGTTGEPKETAEATTTPEPEPSQPTVYIFRDGEGYPVNMEGLTNAWAAEAGFEKRYTITDEERYELASAITAEAVGEPYAGKVAVASITQKQHSDGVKYKFAKIFDVYELLTPAMNKYGVNFDIVGETATRHAENGDLVYYSSFVQHTRNGDRVVWVYEADLTLRWTNADDPEDKLEVTLHAIGTNDGGPDKAKGSAWTYCLKYYLFEKFGIDQGDDDPDMQDHASEGRQQAPQPPTQPQSGAQGRNTQPAPHNAQNGHTGASRPLSDAQLSRMYRKGEDAGLNQQQVNARILQKYGQQDPHNLTRQQYDEICTALDNAKQGGTANV